MPVALDDSRGEGCSPAVEAPLGWSYGGIFDNQLSTEAYDPA